jgi:hypothetical protein
VLLIPPWRKGQSFGEAGRDEHCRLLLEQKRLRTEGSGGRAKKDEQTRNKPPRKRETKERAGRKRERNQKARTRRERGEERERGEACNKSAIKTKLAAGHGIP